MVSKITYQNIKAVGIRLGSSYDLQIRKGQFLHGYFLDTCSRQVREDAVLLRIQDMVRT